MENQPPNLENGTRLGTSLPRRRSLDKVERTPSSSKLGVFLTNTKSKFQSFSRSSSRTLSASSIASDPADPSSSISSFKSCVSKPTSQVSTPTHSNPSLVYSSEMKLSQLNQPTSVPKSNSSNPDTSTSKTKQVSSCRTSISGLSYVPSTNELHDLCQTFKGVIDESQPATTWLSGYQPRSDPEFLQRFLFVDKFNVEKAMKRYRSYYSTVIKIPKVQTVLRGDVEWLRAVYAEIVQGGCFKFYGFDNQNRVVLSFVSANLDPRLISQVYAIVFDCLAFFEFFYATYEQTKSCGVVWVVDHQGFSMSHFRLLAFNKEIHTLHGKLWSGTVPVTLHNIWMCNEGRLISAVFRIFKPFLGKKVMDRVRMVGGDTARIMNDLGGPEYTPDIIPGGKKRAEPALPYEDLLCHLQNALPKEVNST